MTELRCANLEFYKCIAKAEYRAMKNKERERENRESRFNFISYST